MTEQKKGSLLLVALVFGLVGLPPCILGGYVYLERSRFVSRATTAQGEVTAIFLASSTRSGANERRTYAPRVRFQDNSGEWIEFEASASSSDPGFRIGDQVSVLYDPTNPESAKINTFFHLWLFPLILVSLGGIFVVLAIGVSAIQFKENQRLRRV